MCAEYILRVKRHPPPRPNEPTFTAHAFKGPYDNCTVCHRSPNSAIHRPGAPS